MENTIDKLIIEPFESFIDNVISFLPNFLASLLIFILGVLIAVALKKTFTRLFVALGLDKFSEKFGIVEVLKKGGINDPISNLLSRIFCWLTFLVFLIISLRALNISTIERLLEKFFFYLPNIFVAILILFAGYLLSNFLGRAALIASVNAGIKLSGIISKFVQFTVFFISVAMALEQLGIGKETVLLAFAIIYGGVIFALALAFGIGGRDAAKEYIDKRLKGENEKDDIQHL
jgi:hypothetical protein